MIYITQLIYLIEGQEAVFDQFETIAIPAISKYHGELLLRVRPAKHAYIESNIETPYEIHLACFETENDFKNFMQDEERKRFLHLKEQSIKSDGLSKEISCEKADMLTNFYSAVRKLKTILK